MVAGVEMKRITKVFNIKFILLILNFVIAVTSINVFAEINAAPSQLTNIGCYLTYNKVRKNVNLLTSDGKLLESKALTATQKAAVEAGDWASILNLFTHSVAIIQTNNAKSNMFGRALQYQTSNGLYVKNGPFYEPNLIEDINIINTGDESVIKISAKKTLNYTAQISQKVVLEAGEKIVLKPGFLTQSGSQVNIKVSVKE